MPKINLLPKRKRMKISQLKYSNDYNKYYNKFRTLRNSYIMEHPLDELLLLDDIVVPAEHVHHIVPFLNGKTEEEKYFLLLNTNNYISLSEKTHRLIHKDYKRHLSSKQIKYIQDKYDSIMKQLQVFVANNKISDLD